ncbi:MAG: hypothetical protein ACE366_03685 [Bradymonadia bacterium]
MGEADIDQWAVWLHPPEPADAELVRAFAEVMAPAAGWGRNALTRALLQGPCEIVRCATQSEAEQWVTVMESLGGIAEVSLYTPHKVPLTPEPTPIDARPSRSRQSNTLLGADPMGTPSLDLLPPPPERTPGGPRRQTLDIEPSPLPSLMEDPLISSDQQPAVTPEAVIQRQEAPRIHRPQAQPRPRASIGASMPEAPPRRSGALMVTALAASALLGVGIWQWSQSKRTHAAPAASATPTAPALLTPEPLPEPTAEHMASTDEQLVEEPPAEPAEDAPMAAPARTPVQVELSVDELFHSGKQACAKGLYQICKENMERVIKAQPGHQEAYQLMVQAVQHQKAAP